MNNPFNKTSTEISETEAQIRGKELTDLVMKLVQSSQETVDNVASYADVLESDCVATNGSGDKAQGSTSQYLLGLSDIINFLEENKLNLDINVDSIRNSGNNRVNVHILTNYDVSTVESSIDSAAQNAGATLYHISLLPFAYASNPSLLRKEKENVEKLANYLSKPVSEITVSNVLNLLDKISYFRAEKRVGLSQLTQERINNFYLENKSGTIGHLSQNSKGFVFLAKIDDYGPDEQAPEGNSLNEGYNLIQHLYGLNGIEFICKYNGKEILQKQN